MGLSEDEAAGTGADTSESCPGDHQTQTTTMTVRVEVEVEVEEVAAKMKRTVERRKTAQRKRRLIFKAWSIQRQQPAASRDRPAGEERLRERAQQLKKVVSQSHQNIRAEWMELVQS